MPRSVLLPSTALTVVKECPPETATCLGAGWKALRTDSLLAALGLFERAGRLCPSDIGAKVGLGTTHLRLGYLMRADIYPDGVVLSMW